MFKNLLTSFKLAKEKLKVSRDFYILSMLVCVVVTVLVVPSLTFGFILGNLWTRVQILEKGGAIQPDANVPANPNQANPANLTKPTKNDHIRGSANAQVALVSYEDYDCPFCVKFHETANQALKEYPTQLMVVYRHFPLTQLHPEAFKKAVASECVFEQGGDEKFWVFTDKIFASDTEKVTDLPQLVADLGLDVSKYNDCLSKDKYAQKIKDQTTDGEKAGVQGTPGNFLINLKNGKITPLRGAVPYEVLKIEIDRLLK